MEWWEAVETVKPHVVQISTPRGSASGFFISASSTTGICAVATAAHVVGESNWWEEPIRLYHPASGESRILRHGERAIHVRYEMDTAAILFDRHDFPFPSAPLDTIPEGHFLKVGNEIGWIGFPAVSPLDMCFFMGRISAWVDHEHMYLVDGVTINGVSGGPTFAVLAQQRLTLIGVVSAYIPNVATGEKLPGLSVVKDVKQFQELARQFKNLDDAARQQQPPRPPEGPEILSRSQR